MGRITGVIHPTTVCPGVKPCLSGAAARLALDQPHPRNMDLLRHRADLRRIDLLTLLANPFGAYLLFLYQPYFLGLNVPGVWFGLALAIGSGLGIAGQRYAYLLPKKLGARRGLLLATVAPGPLYPLMAVTTHLAVAVAPFCLQWGAILVAPPLLSGYTNAHIPDGYRATALPWYRLRRDHGPGTRQARPGGRGRRRA
jgi:hypothetical protein